MTRGFGFRWGATASVVVALAVVGTSLPVLAAPMPGASSSSSAGPATAAALAASTPGAAAAPSRGVGALADSKYQVTVAARTCTSYSAIMANRARNNIQESLRDLGPDTLYRDGQAISPAVEDVQATTQVSGCAPLVGWKFQLGRGIAGKVDQLSTVSRS
jgi:hypothetical protein